MGFCEKELAMRRLLASKFKGQSLKSLLVRLHSDEQGAEALEKLLIIGAFVLPLLGLLFWYKDDLARWVNEWWERRKGEANEGDYSPDGSPVPD